MNSLGDPSRDNSVLLEQALYQPLLRLLDIKTKHQQTLPNHLANEGKVRYDAKHVCFIQHVAQYANALGAQDRHSALSQIIAEADL